MLLLKTKSSGPPVRVAQAELCVSSGYSYGPLWVLFTSFLPYNKRWL